MRVSCLVLLSFLEPSASWQQLLPQTRHSYHRSIQLLVNVGFLDAKKRSAAFVGGALYINQDVEEEREDDMPTRFEDFLNSDEDSFELKPAKKADTPPMMPAPRRRTTPPVMPAPRKRLEKPPTSSKDAPASSINKELSAYDAYLASDNLSPISGGTSNDESNPGGKTNISAGRQSPFLAFIESDEDGTSFNSCAPSEATPAKQSVNPSPSIGAQPTQKELSAYDAYLASENLPPVFGGNTVSTGIKKVKKPESKQTSFLAFLYSDEDVFDSKAPPPDKPQLELNTRGLEDQYTTNLVGGAYIPPGGIFLEGASPVESEPVVKGGQSPFFSFLESTETTFQGQMKYEPPKEPLQAMSLDEAQTVDLADTFDLTDRQRQAWLVRDDELQRQLAAQLDLDEQEENGEVPGRASLIVPNELSSSTVDKLREMLVSANPADEESNVVANAKERVVGIFRGVTKERSLVFAAGGLTVVLGRRFLRLLIGGGML